MFVLQYYEWKETAETLQLISQMIGKVKLEYMEAEPEWAHTLLEVSANGFTTGLICNENKSFMIELDVEHSQVIATRQDGLTSNFSLMINTSISEYFEMFNKMLEEINCSTTIYTIPQEMSTTTPFELDINKREYSEKYAKKCHEMFIFAYNAITKFIAPYRCKKLKTTYFWGTFDLAGILFSGKGAPFPEKRTIIEDVAFDEEMLEVGFWPGDANNPQPSFYVLPYPFLTQNLSNEPILPNKAYYSNEKVEFFLTLEDALSYDNPEQAIQDFFTSAYSIIARTQSWDNVEWFNKPLLTSKGSHALKNK